MKILVTGGAGFIGSHISESFLNNGWEVVVLDNFTTGRHENLAHIADKIKIVVGDIRDTSVVNETMKGCHAVVHLAALASVPASFNNPVETYEVNFIGTQNVLEAARQNNVQRVTFASSSAVYGDTELLPITEENPETPLSPYGVSKLLGEKLCKFYNTVYGLEVVIFRFFNVYGPRQNPFSEYSAVIPKFLSIIKDGGSPIIFGDGEQTRDFIYISDLVRAHELALEVTKSRSHEVTPATENDPVTLCLCDSVTTNPFATPLNLGSGQKTSLNELISIISDQLGKPVNAIKTDARAGDILHSFCKIDKVNTVLTFKPEVSMKIGIEKMLKNYNFVC